MVASSQEQDVNATKRAEICNASILLRSCKTYQSLILRLCGDRFMILWVSPMIPGMELWTESLSAKMEPGLVCKLTPEEDPDYWFPVC